MWSPYYIKSCMLSVLFIIEVLPFNVSILNNYMVPERKKMIILGYFNGDCGIG